MKQILEFTYISNNTKRAFFVDDSVDLKSIAITYSPEDTVHRRNFFICSTYAIPITIQQTNLNTGVITTSTGYIQSGIAPTVSSPLHNPCYWFSETTYVTNTRDIMVSDVAYFDLLPSETIPYYKHGINYVALYGDDARQQEYLRTHGGDIPRTAPTADWIIYFSQSEKPTINIVASINGLEDDQLKTAIVHVEAYDFENLLPVTYEVANVAYTSIPYRTNYYLLSSIVDKAFNPNLIAEIANITRPYVKVNLLYYDENNEQKSTSQMYFIVNPRVNSPTNPHGYIPTVEQDGSTIEIRMGYPEDDEDYQDIIDDIDAMSKPSDNLDPNKHITSNGVGNRQYAITTSKVNELCNYLWNSSLLDDLKLINNNPIENIVSLKIFPFEIVSGTQVPILLGNVETTVTGVPIPSTFNAVRVIASGLVKPFYNNFLDLDGYTSLQIQLPFIGMKELSPSLCMGKAINVQYIIDIISGACKAMIYIAGSLMYQYEGSIGIEVPLTSSNRAQMESAYVTSALGTVLNIATENYMGAISSAVSGALSQFHSQTSGRFTPNCEGYSPRGIYLKYNRPDYQDIATFNHTHGRMCNLSLNLGSLKGFTKCAEGVDLKGVNANQTEKDELLSLLTSGIYL